jgi:surface carbohydrate biosynthesis protein
MTVNVTSRLAWEHTHRELLPALLALKSFREHGHRPLLEHVSAIGTEPYSRDVLFLPFYYDDQVRDRYLTRRETRGSWLVNLAYEQMHFRCGRGYLLPDGAFAREEMLHCAWGPRFEELLLEHGIPKERIRLVGHPRFDIYHHPALLFDRAYLANRYRLDPDKPWVLVPYNFNMAYISDKLRAQLVARKYALTDEFIAGFGRARDAFTAMMRLLAREFPEIEFVLRVHPAGYESQSLYAGESRTYPNLHTIAEYDIANWITQAALTIVWNSTSAMEALAAGRPVVSYEPFPFSGPFEFDVNKILTTFSNVDDVVSLVRRLPGVELGHDRALFERWYAFNDGRTSERLAQIADECRAEPERFASKANGRRNLRIGYGRELERILKPVPRASRVASRLFKLDSPPAHRAPEPVALEQAARRLSPEPLEEFLR